MPSISDLTGESIEIETYTDAALRRWFIRTASERLVGAALLSPRWRGL